MRFFALGLIAALTAGASWARVDVAPLPPRLQQMVDVAAPLPVFVPGRGADRVQSATIGTSGGWDVKGNYEWKRGAWQLMSVELVSDEKIVSQGDVRPVGFKSQGAGASPQTEPETPRDPARPTLPGYVGQVANTTFTTGGWTYSIAYSYGVNELGVLGWHITSVTATRVAPIRPPTITQ